MHSAIWRVGMRKAVTSSRQLPEQNKRSRVRQVLQKPWAPRPNFQPGLGHAVESLIPPGGPAGLKTNPTGKLRAGVSLTPPVSSPSCALSDTPFSGSGAPRSSSLHLHRQRPHQPQSRRRVQKNSHHQRPPFDLFIQPKCGSCQSRKRRILSSRNAPQGSNLSPEG
jgi:hypothetical protein